MRLAKATFSSILIKIGNGDLSEPFEFDLIESRFFEKADARRLCPNGIRLFQTKFAVDQYNNEILEEDPDKVISVATITL